MVDKVIVSFVTAVLLVSLGIQLLLSSLPLFLRIEFDALCHQYILLMDQAGGLTGTAAGQMVRDFEARRFTILELQGTEQAAYGEDMVLYVRAAFPGYQLRLDLGLEETPWVFESTAKLVCRVTADFGAAP